jgi:small-conductance mechanosensitive channel
MNPPDKFFLGSLTGALASLVTGWMRDWLGVDANQIVFGKVTRADLAATVFFLLAVLVVNALAAASLLLKIPQEEGLPAIRAFFDKLSDFGVFVVLFRLFFRFTRVLEAGVVVVILGFAAQKTSSNLFAGFQLAMTQPSRRNHPYSLPRFRAQAGGGISGWPSKP